MKARQWITIVALLVLVGATIFGLIITDNHQATVPKLKGKTAPPPLVDQKPLATARKLAALASTQEELDFAHEALRASDYEVDLAFADALRDATEHPAPLTAEQKELGVRVTKAEAVVKADQEQVAHLTHQLAAAPESEKETVQDQLDVIKAQLELDQDELDDARQDLERAGGNAQGKIQRLLQEHEAGHTDAQPGIANASPDADYQSSNLAPQIRAWLALQNKNSLLAQARQDALDSVPALTRAHDASEQRLESQQDQKQAVKDTATGLAKGQAPANAATSKKEATKAALASLKHFSEDQKAVSDLDKRIEAQHDLADVYQNWSALIATRQRTALHMMLQSALWILLILLSVYLAGRLIDRYFVDLAGDKRRLITLRAVVWFAVQALGVLVIAFVVFGMPSQTPTVLGLAGAGLTVALKDFIVGFVGWFVLMGRNGIRVGDWVEINGVGGEVVEIGLLRTTLLETGNWADSGHPTGRKVTFVNSFAIEGHFFNFSTSGQWLWDELTVSVPGGQNPYPVIEAIQKLVVKETEANTHLAEEEWQRASTRYKLKSFSARPAINLRPTGGGVEVHVRYITRAQERQATRAHLYEAIVELLHGKEAQSASSPSDK